MATGVLKAVFPLVPIGLAVKTSGKVMISFVSVVVSSIVTARNKAVSLRDSAFIQSGSSRHVFKLLPDMVWLMSWGKLLPTLLLLVILSVSLPFEATLARHRKNNRFPGDITGFLPPGNHEVYLDVQILSEQEARVIVTFKAMDQISWFMISSQYAKQRADLALDLERFIADSLWVDLAAVKRRGIEIDVKSWKIWLLADVDISNSTLISRKGREIQICIRDPIFEEMYEGVMGWIDRINVTVAEGMKIVSSSPGENIVDYKESGVLWEIPSMEKASPTYCVNVRLKGIVIPSWLILVVSFVVLALLYFILSKKLRKPSQEPFLST